MFKKLVISFSLLCIFNKNEIFSTPVGVLKPFQMPNGINALAYQQKNLHPPQNREKRFLDDFMDFFSLFDDFFYSDEEDDSSEEQINGTATQQATCCNCSCTCKQIKQVQHIHQTELPLSTQQSQNSRQGQEDVPSAETLRSNENGIIETVRALKMSATNKTEITSSTKYSEKPGSIAATQETMTNAISVSTQSSSSSLIKTSTTTSIQDVTTSSTATEPITTDVKAVQE